MKVLFLSPNVPYPPLNGGQHRNLGLIRSAARFASVRVLAIGEPAAPRVEQARRHLSALGVELEVFQPTGPGRPEQEATTDRLPDAACHFRSPELREAIRRSETDSHDLAHVEEMVMAQYLDLLACPVVVDRHKVDWAYHQAMAAVAPAEARVHLDEAARFRYWEGLLRGSFERILVPGASDRALLEAVHGPGTVTVIPIGIADDLRPPSAHPGRIDHVLLYGALDYAPNVAAQRFFFDDVWPELRRCAPQLTVRLVGSGRPPLGGPQPADARVEMRGYVPDLVDVLGAPGVLLVPLRVGGGARTKILEALACGMPIVSTAVGVENLDLVPERDFLLAETAQEFQQAVLRLSRDPELVCRLSRRGPECAESHRWSHIEPRLEPVYRHAAAAGRRPRPAPPAEGALAASRAPAGVRARASWPVRALDRQLQRALNILLLPSQGSRLLELLRRRAARLLAAVFGR
ncbi:MAG TPA: glycosyltransferase family 4 protein [Vicinamibacteria bacterium]|nr:glycosyltransferase family 4 protein [Vicinamibacteria bacterium]